MDATEAKFGSTKRTLALGGLFWLRFICPAIVDPVQSGVLKRSPCTIFIYPDPYNFVCDLFSKLTLHTAAVGPELQRALLSLSKAVKACSDGQIPENLNAAAALQLKELSVQWRPRIDACFLELRQPTGRISPRKGDYKEALVAAMTGLSVLQRSAFLIC